MGLTLPIEMEIKRAKLDKVYDQHKATWITLAAETLKHVRKNYPKGATIRQDDVAENMEKLLKVNVVLKNFLDQKRLRPKYWFTYFAVFIIDRGWTEIEQEAAKMTAKEKQTQEFVRKIIRDTFGQKVNERQVKSVASQIVKATTIEAKPAAPRKRA